MRLVAAFSPETLGSLLGFSDPLAALKDGGNGLGKGQGLNRIGGETKRRGRKKKEGVVAPGRDLATNVQWLPMLCHLTMQLYLSSCF